MTAPNPLLEAALSYAAQGFHVLPVWPDGSKRPWTEHGWKDATTRARRIRDVWDDSRWRDRGQHALPWIGVVGHLSGLAFLDVDPRNGGVVPEGLPETRVERTPGGGWHYWFRVEPGRRSRPSWAPVSTSSTAAGTRWWLPRRAMSWSAMPQSPLGQRDCPRTWRSPRGASTVRAGARTRSWPGSRCAVPSQGGHERTPSLQVAKTAGGKVLLHCFAGCVTEDVIEAGGWEWADLFPAVPGVEFEFDEDEEQSGGDQQQARSGTAKRRRWKRLADVVEEKVTWLWSRRLPRAKFTLLAGDPEAGKTFAAGAICAGLTAGTPLPDAGAEILDDRAVVIFLTYEDGLADTIRPRLRRAGADLGRVIVLDKGEVPVTATDIDEVRTLVGELRAAGVRTILLVIDPLMSFIGGKTDTYTDNEVRAVLGPWVAMAEAEALTILALIHLNKGDAKPLYRVLASIAFVGLSRVVLVAGPVPSRRDRLESGPEQMGLGILKSNLASKEGVIEYAIIDEDGPGTGVLRWGAYRPELRADLVGKPRGRPDESREEARELLDKALADGPRQAKHLREEAEQEGISWATLRRAKKDMGVRAYRSEVPGAWWWAKASFEFEEGEEDGGDDSAGPDHPRDLLLDAADAPAGV